MKLSLSGQYRDIVADRGGSFADFGERRNAVVFRSLDLIAGLLSNEDDLAGILYWAVGEGDPAWDADPPSPDRKTTRLTRETYRKLLDPRQDIAYDADTRTLTISTTFGEEEANGSLREFGLYGGNASARPDSGYLINHAVHPLIEKTEDATLDREVRLTLASDDATGSALDLVARLLAGSPGLEGIQYWATGTGDPAWDDAPPDEDLTRSSLIDEVLRRAVDVRRDVSYVPDIRTLIVRAELGYDDAPVTLREFGLFGGNASREPDSGFLISYQTHPAINKAQPLVLSREFRLTLGADIVVAVPDVSGQTVDAAQASIAVAGLTMGRVLEEERDSGHGLVLSQQPPAGELVAEGAVVHVTIAVATLVAVPDLTGLTPDEADGILLAAGLSRDDEILEEENSARPGTIVRQIPAAGLRVRQGSSVVVVVATPVTALVPMLAGLSVGEASVTAGMARLRLAPPPHPIVGATAVYNTVVEQEPSAGDRAPVASEIVITLAAPWSVEVPDITGLAPADAAARLREAAAALLQELGRTDEPPGLAIGSQTQVESEQSPGTVATQNPSAGVRVPLYATVDVALAVPITAQVPDLSGMTAEDASAALEAAGYVQGRTTQRLSVSTARTVIEQNPPAGVMAARGSAIDLILAEAFMVATPSLVDRPLEYAVEVVTSRGLVLATPTHRVSNRPADTVLSQNPEAGTLLPLGSTVEIVVASAETRVIVPNVVRLLVDEARTVLARAGLTIEIGAQLPGDEEPGTIVAQSPEAGTPVSVESTVTVTVVVRRQSSRDLVGALGPEPDSLYLHGSAMLVTNHVLQALYDGPFDQRRFDYQPVILQAIREPEVGQVTVSNRQRFVQNGQIQVARPGVPVRTVQMRVVFRMRDGLHWDDGTQVTAEDSVFAFNVASDPATPVSKLRVDRTLSYEAIDDQTVVWTGLPGWTDAAFMHNFWTPLPAHLLANMSPQEILQSDFGRRPMGYGPFTLADRSSDDLFTLERHPAYFRESEELPVADRIDLHVVRTSDEVFERLVGGELDFALTGSLGLHMIRPLRDAAERGDIEFHAVAGNAQEWLMLNQDRERSPLFTDRRVRQAIAFGIDRVRIIEEIFAGETRPGDSFVPASHPMHAGDLRRYDFDPDIAHQLLEEAGLSGGFETRMLVPSGRDDRLRVGRLIAENLADLGIHVDIEEVEPRELFAKGPETLLFGRRFDMALVCWVAGAEPHGELFLSEEISRDANGFGGTNITGFNDRSFDATVLGAMTQPDVEHRQALWEEAQRVFAEMLPSIPLYQHIRIAATRTGFSGFSLDPSQPSEMWNVERFT